MTRNFAAKLLQAEGVSPDKAKVGAKWIQRLYTRHPEIHTKRGTKLPSDRARRANSQTIEEFYKSLKELVVAKKITPHHMYNMDESGITNGLGVRGKVIGSLRTSRTHVEQHGGRVWTSSIHAIGATGTSTTTFIIFKGKTMQAQWFPCEFPNWHFHCLNNGWTTNALGFYWLTTVFLPETQPEDPSQWRLLLLDGHGSHESVDFMYEAWINKVHLLYLLAHTSHVLQPLDLSLFSPLKHYYRQEYNVVAQFYDTHEIKLQHYITCYCYAFRRAFTKENVKAGFRGSGIHPFRPAIVLKSSQLLAPSESQRLDDLMPRSPEFWTPRNSKDVQKRARKVADKVTSLRSFARDVGKGLDKANARNILLKEENLRLKRRLEAAKPSKRKRIKPNPNEMFVSIEKIREEVTKFQSDRDKRNLGNHVEGSENESIVDDVPRTNLT